MPVVRRGTMTAMTNIVDNQHGYSISIPEQTPHGQTVTIESGDHERTHIMHAESSDQSELYFEVATYSKVLDHHELASEQQAYLREEASNGHLSAIQPGIVGHFTGTTFDFQGLLQGRWKVRRFLFVDTPQRTYRIVFDPTSPLNEQILDTLQIDR